MKKFLLITLFTFSSHCLFAQIPTAFIPDTFEDGTTQGWSNGANSPNPPINIPTGGPDGADDNFLEEVSSGVGMGGSRWVIFNTDTRWLGDYSNDVRTVRFHAKNAGNTDLHFRVAFEGLGTQIVTNDAFVLPTTQTDWILVDITVTGVPFTLISGTASIFEVLENVEEIRILSSVAPNFVGDQIDAVGHIDNILLVPTLSVDDVTQETVSLYPNPVTTVLNIDSETPIQSIAIFNVLGSQVLEAKANGLQNQVDLSSFDVGIYFVQISSGNSQKTFRVIKE